MKHLKIFFLILVNFTTFIYADDNNSKVQAPLFDNLGSFHFPITINSSLAQRFFDQGVVLYYGFEWGESIRSFREAVRLDPTCAMCYWGIALALGSKINAPASGHEYKDAKTAITKAISLKQKATPAEQAYIQSLALRFKHKPKTTSSTTGEFSCHKSATLFDASSKNEIADYAKAMKQVTVHFPEDNNAKALYAFALFDSIDWDFWDANQKINPLTPTLIQTLKTILARDKFHIGGNHYFIHVIEQSPRPADALDSANRLQTLVPGSEHLVHMPAHIYFLTGKYHEATFANEAAIKTFKNYNNTCKAKGFVPEINYLYFHNYDFLRTTATMEGRSQLALTAAHEMLLEPFPSWLVNSIELQWFIPIPFFVEARFGLWDEILKETKPIAKYQYALGMWHYARGMAYIYRSQIKKANLELSELEQIINKGPNDNNLQKKGVQLLNIANYILKAKIADNKRHGKTTISYLKSASQIQHDMGYHEPPDWYFPVNEALADAYLKYHQPNQARRMYEQVLKQYPSNGWALYGLARTLDILGEKTTAVLIQKEFNHAWENADITIPIVIF